jgi:hypothetical protein
MPALVAGIHVFNARRQDVDGRNKSGHDELSISWIPACAGMSGNKNIALLAYG